MKVSVRQAVDEAKRLGAEHAENLSKVIIDGDPDNQNELMMIVGSYMGTLDAGLKKAAETK